MTGPLSDLDESAARLFDAEVIELITVLRSERLNATAILVPESMRHGYRCWCLSQSPPKFAGDPEVVYGIPVLCTPGTKWDALLDLPYTSPLTLRDWLLDEVRTMILGGKVDQIRIAWAAFERLP